jgi:O-antigen/teichoic acid export membrane protein
MVVLTFAAFLSGSSFSANLMLQPVVTRDDIRFSFTWQMLAGLVSAGAMFTAAPWLASFFGDPLVEGMVQWLALACLFTAAAGPATFLLQRDMNFRALGLVQLASYAIGYLAVGLPMALHGWGATSLAIACVVQAGVAMVLTYAVKPHTLRPLLFHAGAMDTLVTGRAVFTTNVVNWLLTNLDRAVIGRLLNAHAVGLYTVAYNFANIPNTLLLGALQPAFMATGAKLQQEPRRLAEAWLLGMSCILVLALPAAIVLALLSRDLVALLYGAAWSETGWVLGLLFLCLPAWACWGFSTPVLWNTGRRHLEALLQLPLLALALPAWWLLTPYGIRAAAAVSVAVIFLRAGVIIAAALRALSLGWSALLPFGARGLGLGALGAAAVVAAQQATAGSDLPAVRLLAGGACALLVLLGIIGFFPRVLGPEARGALARLIPALGLREPAGLAGALPPMSPVAAGPLPRPPQ